MEERRVPGVGGRRESLSAWHAGHHLTLPGLEQRPRGARVPPRHARWLEHEHKMAAGPAWGGNTEKWGGQRNKMAPSPITSSRMRCFFKASPSPLSLSPFFSPPTKNVCRGVFWKNNALSLFFLGGGGGETRGRNHPRVFVPRGRK